MPFFKNQDTQLYYEIHGNGDPLIIIPGGGADGRFYLTIVESLKKHFQIILPDPRASGRSKKGKQTYSFDLLASDASALLDHLNIKSTYVMGHSMGGMVAQHVAYQYPNYVKKLILFATASSLSGLGKHCCKTAALVKTEASLKTFINVMAIWNFSDSFLKNEENINNLISGAEQDPYPLKTASLIEQMKIINAFDSLNNLRKIKAPTLVIGCEKDIIFPAESVKKMASMIEHAEYCEIPNATHSIHIEQPAIVAKIIKQFLSA